MTTLLIRDHCVRYEKRRGVQPPWYLVAVLRCPACGNETCLRKSWHGPTPNGGIACPHCDRQNNQNEDH